MTWISAIFFISHNLVSTCKHRDILDTEYCQLEEADILVALEITSVKLGSGHGCSR
jgi:hypothetical protein